MIVNKPMVLSWYERLTFVKNEVQTEIDNTVPGTDPNEEALQTVNEAINEARGKILDFAQKAGFPLFPAKTVNDKNH